MNVRPIKKGRSTIIQTDISPAEGREMTGSASPDLAMVLMAQASAATWIPSGDPERQAEWTAATFNAMRGVAPADPVEGMFATQMVATHNAAMECFRRAHLPEQTFEGHRQGLEFANKLVRSYAALVEALARHRGKGQQTVRVEYVHVHSGGQAIVGAVSGPGGGGSQEIEGQPHAHQLAYAPQPALRGADSDWEPVPIASGAGPTEV